jgi:thiol:disulfide interchange protein DsbA
VRFEKSARCKQVSNSFLTTASRGTTMNTKLALSAIVAALMLTACAKQESAAPEAAPAAPAAEAPAAAPDASATPPADATAPAGDAAAAPPAEAPKQ